MAASFTPITKNDAARICQVSLRTINKWIEEKNIPIPNTISSSRKMYWHPDVFYCWLNKELGAPVVQTCNEKGSIQQRGRPRNKLPARLQ